MFDLFRMFTNLVRDAQQTHKLEGHRNEFPCVDPLSTPLYVMCHDLKIAFPLWINMHSTLSRTVRNPSCLTAAGPIEGHAPADNDHRCLLFVSAVSVVFVVFHPCRRGRSFARVCAVRYPPSPSFSFRWKSLWKGSGTRSPFRRKFRGGFGEGTGHSGTPPSESGETAVQEPTTWDVYFVNCPPSLPA